jgi:hypothetical protein
MDEIQIQDVVIPNVVIPEVVIPEVEMVEEPAPLTQSDYEFIDEIIAFENDGILMTCENNRFYSTVIEIFKRVIDIGRVALAQDKNADGIFTKIGLLISVMYFWGNDYAQMQTPLKLKFMNKTCFDKFTIADKSTNIRMKTDILNFQKYLCFAVFIVKLAEFDTQEMFLIEWMSYSEHKKNIFKSLVATCLLHATPDKGMPPFNGKITEPVFQEYIIGQYNDFTEGNVFKQYYDFYDYAIKAEARIADENADKFFFDEPITNKQKQKTKNKQSTNKKQIEKKEEPHTKQLTKKNTIDSDRKEEPHTKQQHHVEDDTGFTMVKQDIRFRYLLKSQDYDTINTHTREIIQPICLEFGSRPCLSRFRDKMSGKYIDISIDGNHSAHISYYHHSKDQYHFKIDNPAIFGLPPLSQKQYTVPFNFHLNPVTRQLTFAIRHIDNPNTEAECPDRDIIRMVHDILTNHIEVLQQQVVRVGLGYKPHKSKRCNRRDKRCKITRRHPRPRRRRL